MKVSNCRVVNCDRMIKTNKLKKKRSLIEFLNYDPLYVGEVLEKRSKLVCKLGDKDKREVFEYYNLDSTVLEFELRKNEFLDIYESEDKKNFYIDTSFLKRPK